MTEYKAQRPNFVASSHDAGITAYHSVGPHSGGEAKVLAKAGIIGDDEIARLTADGLMLLWRHGNYAFLARPEANEAGKPAILSLPPTLPADIKVCWVDGIKGYVAQVDGHERADIGQTAVEAIANLYGSMKDIRPSHSTLADAMQAAVNAVVNPANIVGVGPAVHVGPVPESGSLYRYDEDLGDWE